MNYYERHIGDFIRDTVSLSMLEDGAYNRLIDQYYQTERPLPADKKMVYRLARATTAAERKAVDFVLQSFFAIEDDGWHQKRCDLVIEEYLEGEPEREAKRTNTAERQRRTRERRAAMFQELARHGIHPDWNASMATLKDLLSRVTEAVTERDESQPVTRDTTATQTPDTRHQINNSLTARDDRLAIAGLSDHHPQDWQPDQQRLAAYLRQAGIPMPDDTALANSLTRFNLHNHGKALTESQRYSKLVTWLTGDHRNAQSQRPQNPGSTAPASAQPTRRLTAAEQVEQDCRAELDRIRAGNGG